LRRQRTLFPPLGASGVLDPHNRLINAWLDARTETDHLEGRTLKCVVVVEALIAMTTHADKTIAKPVRDPVAWEQLYDTIISVLPAEAAESLSLRMWQSLNAASFRDKLAAVCERHRITVPLADVAAFSQVRNAIVHRFDYDHRLRLPSQWGMEDHRKPLSISSLPILSTNNPPAFRPRCAAPVY